MYARALTLRVSWVTVSSKRSRQRGSVNGSDLPHGEVQTDFSTVTLTPDPGNTSRVTLYIDGVPSSHIDLEDPTHLEFKYMQWMAGMLNAWFAPDRGLRVMHLGAAGCTMARYINATRPTSHQLALEVDSKLAQFCRQWFDLPRAPQLRIRIEDGRTALNTSAPQRWEVIIRDAFVDSQVPNDLTSFQAVSQVHRALTPDGIYLANCADFPPLPLARREVATLAQFFGKNIMITAEPGVFSGRRHGNVIILAAKDHDRLSEVSARIGRNLRTSSIPARLITARELEVFAAGATPFSDD